MRTAVVGHYTWFENHFPERWRTDPTLLCLDVEERDYSWLIALRNYRPDVTLFFRPELYPEPYLRHVSGIRVAMLSEPLPSISDGQLLITRETMLRMTVYRRMAWHSYDWRIFYDPGKAASATKLGFRIDEFRPMPIDTKSFRPPPPGAARPYDVFFVGKATPHRIAVLDFLRLSRLRFLWIAHGVSGWELASLFRRSRVVLNVHADGSPAMEPRLYLAAACGCRVVTESLPSPPTVLIRRIVEETQPWTEETLREHAAAQAAQPWTAEEEDERQSLSTRRLIEQVYARFQIAVPSASEAYA